MNERRTVYTVEIAKVEGQIRRLQALKEKLIQEVESKKASIEQVNAVIQYPQSRYKA